MNTRKGRPPGSCSVLFPLVLLFVRLYAVVVRSTPTVVLLILPRVAVRGRVRGRAARLAWLLPRRRAGMVPPGLDDLLLRLQLHTVPRQSGCVVLYVDMLRFDGGQGRLETL